MKTVIIISSILIGLIAVTIIIFNQTTDKQLKTEVVINASAQEVWAILMDFKSFPDWNPFIKNISGIPTQGEHISVTIKSPESEPMQFQPLILANQENQEFRWKGKLGVNGVFDGEHYFRLEEVGTNKTKLIHGENFSGILSGLLLSLIKDNTEKGFISMNTALKSKAESN